MSSESDHLHRTGSLYGAFAFGSVIVSCFAGYFFYNPRFFINNEWMVLVTFALGAIYAVLGVLGASCFDCRKGRVAILYFTAQCAILTAMIELSPIRGFFGIIALPVISQAIFDLRPR